MAYVPPHMRKGHTVRSPAASMLIPRFRKNLHFRSSEPKPNTDRSGKIVYAGTAISRWFAVDSNSGEIDSQSLVLRHVSVEHLERITGRKPLTVMKGSLLNGGQASPDDSRKPWAFIAEKILQDLMYSSEVVRSLTEGEEGPIKPKLVARVGRVLFLPRWPSVQEEELNEGPFSEASLERLNRSFRTDVPASYMKIIVDDVVPNIGVEFKDLKDVYHVRLSDKSRPGSTISCRCRLTKEDNQLELYKVESNQVRHMVYDNSCVGKYHDLRLLLSTKQLLTSLADDEMESIRNLIAAAALDPNSKGGLRWPFGSASSHDDRYRVIGVWHTVSRIYESPSINLKVRDADRFDFKTSCGEFTREVTVKLKGLTSELLGKKPDNDSVTRTFEDALKLLWEHFLVPSISDDTNSAAMDFP